MPRTWNQKIEADSLRQSFVGRKVFQIQFPLAARNGVTRWSAASHIASLLPDHRHRDALVWSLPPRTMASRGRRRNHARKFAYLRGQYRPRTALHCPVPWTVLPDALAFAWLGGLCSLLLLSRKQSHAIAGHIQLTKIGPINVCLLIRGRQMATQRLALSCNVITGRMGSHHHLIRAIFAFRACKRGSLQIGDRVMPEPILVGRSREKSGDRQACG